MSTVGQEMDWSRELAGFTDMEVAGHWLEGVAGQVRDGITYWHLMREVWVRAESGDGWLPALLRFPEHRAAAMTEDERAARAPHSRARAHIFPSRLVRTVNGLRPGGRRVPSQARRPYLLSLAAKAGSIAVSPGGHGGMRAARLR